MSQLPVPRQIQRGLDFGFAHLLEQFAVQAELSFVAAGFLGEKAFEVAAGVVAVKVPARVAEHNERFAVPPKGQRLPT